MAGIESEQQQQTDRDAGPSQSNIEPRPNAGFGEWRPSIVIGSPLWLEGEDLNAIEIADRKIAQTRLWANHYRGVPEFAQMLQEAIREREQLDETARVNTQPR